MTPIIHILIVSILGFIIGFIVGMIGLVLGVLRFPIILGNEISASVTAGTNIGKSTLGAAFVLDSCLNFEFM